jgi:hypothetical protein
MYGLVALVLLTLLGVVSILSLRGPANQVVPNVSIEFVGWSHTADGIAHATLRLSNFDVIPVQRRRHATIYISPATVTEDHYSIDLGSTRVLAPGENEFVDIVAPKSKVTSWRASLGFYLVESEHGTWQDELRHYFPVKSRSRDGFQPIHVFLSPELPPPK